LSHGSEEPSLPVLVPTLKLAFLKSRYPDRLLGDFSSVKFLGGNFFQSAPIFLDAGFGILTGGENEALGGRSRMFG
jgi:hypothetical protein